METAAMASADAVRIEGLRVRNVSAQVARAVFPSQPDVTDRALRTESVRVPEALVWSQPDSLKKSVIIPAPLPGAKSPDAPLSLDLPQRDVKIVERHMPVVTPAAEPHVFPATTSTAPVKTKMPDEGNQIPETLSRVTSEKSAGHLISVSDI